MNPRPIVAVVGRPNVGKSTLFNRLVRRRVALVYDEPGVTRDRNYADATSLGRDYLLVDTGGLDPAGDDPMRHRIAEQVEIAIEEADTILCVLDAITGATDADREAVQLLRQAGKPVIYVANKADGAGGDAAAADLYRLGVDHIIPVSALHGRGVPALESALVATFPPEIPVEESDEEGEEAEVETIPRIAIIGRPNAGKSSLINRLAGEDRMLVDHVPGTTRDSIDTEIVRQGRRIVLVDTAGIRRKARVRKDRDYVETASVLQAIRAMERSDIAVLVCDVAEGVAEQDAKILGLATERGRGIIVALNKIDLLEDVRRKKLEQDARDTLSFIPWAPIVPISASTGRGVGNLVDTLFRVHASYRKRVTTGELNRFFEQVLATRPPPTQRGRAPRLYYITQAQTSPPHFIVMSNEPEYIHFSYQRFVSNRIRQAFGFEGVPLKVTYRKRRRRGES